MKIYELLPIYMFLLAFYILLLVIVDDLDHIRMSNERAEAFAIECMEGLPNE